MDSIRALWMFSIEFVDTNFNWRITDLSEGYPLTDTIPIGNDTNSSFKIANTNIHAETNYSN